MNLIKNTLLGILAVIALGLLSCKECKECVYHEGDQNGTSLAETSIGEYCGDDLDEIESKDFRCFPGECWVECQ